MAQQEVQEKPRPMRADARRNYERLVEAARKVFNAQGTGASMEAIAKEAAVGVGTLYRHFPTRVDVVEAVYREDIETLVRQAERGAAELGPWEGLEVWMKAFVDYARSKRILLNELREAFEKNPDLRSNARDRIVEACSLVLVRAQDAGEVRPDVDAEDLMQLLPSMCSSSTLTGDQAERLTALILDGLRQPS